MSEEYDTERLQLSLRLKTAIEEHIVESKTQITTIDIIGALEGLKFMYLQVSYEQEKQRNVLATLVPK